MVAKTLIRAAPCLLCLAAAACADPAAPIGLALRLPAVPAAWESAVGAPRWLVEWRGPDGQRRASTAAAAGALIELPAGAVAAVAAYPYWDGVPAGVARPAGGIYPFQARAGELRLTWPGGVAAEFFAALAAAGGGPATAPERFNWPRFLSGPAAGELPAAAGGDPWQVDWAAAAARARAGGTGTWPVRPARDVRVVVPAAGPWAPASPFAAAPILAAGAVAVLASAAPLDAAFSRAGVLRFGGGAVAWFPAPP